MRSDLQRLKRDTDSGRSAAAVSGETSVHKSSSDTLAPAAPRKSGKFGAIAGGALLLALLAGGLYFYYRNQNQKKLTDKDTLVLADFANSTGDAVFDDTLRTALVVAVNQSPFLNVLGENKVAATLKLMAKPANTALAPEVASEVCQRTGGKAYIAGSIAALGNEYVLGLKAVNCQSGDVLAQEQATAANKEKVLEALGQATARLREQLGESLTSVKKFDAPLADATTTSLEALKTYSLGLKTKNEKGNMAALPYFQHAIELDPNFSMAYVQVGDAYAAFAEVERPAEYLKKAFDLREHASERERYDITGGYYDTVTGEQDKAIKAYKEYIQAYPRYAYAYNRLANAYTSMGQYDSAIDAYRQATVVDPTISPHTSTRPMPTPRFKKSAKVAPPFSMPSQRGKMIFCLITSFTYGLFLIPTRRPCPNYRPGTNRIRTPSTSAFRSFPTPRLITGTSARLANLPRARSLPPSRLKARKTPVSGPKMVLFVRSHSEIPPRAFAMLPLVWN